MREIAARDLPIERVELPKDEAIAFFEREGEPYKTYFATTKGDATVSIYRQGELDRLLPRPPRSVDRQAQGLQAPLGRRRVLAREREEQDAPAHLRHRVLHAGRAGRAPEAPRRGAQAGPQAARERARPVHVPPVRSGRRLLDRARDRRSSTCSNAYLRQIQTEDYVEIKTPLLYNRQLWELSGHWGKYRDNMFLVLDAETGEHEIGLKPMNCPSHYIYYASKTHSYRELPIRFTTYDVLHRNERSGTLSGLTRVRQFQQDDCHIFLREDQIEAGGQDPHRIHPGLLRDVRPEGLAQVRHAAGDEDRRRRHVGSGRIVAPRRARCHRTSLRAERGGRRLLRAEDRLRRRGFPRAEVAAGHDPAGLRRPGAVRARIRRRGQRAAPAGRHPPGRQRIVRAVHRDPDRALRRGVSVLAGPRAGARPPDHGPGQRLRRDGAEAVRGRGLPSEARRPEREDRREDQGRPASQGPVHVGGRRPRSRRAGRSPFAHVEAATSAR